MFPRIEYEHKLHQPYVLGRIRDFEEGRAFSATIICVDTGGGSEMGVERKKKTEDFSSSVYYISWPDQVPIIVSAYGGYNAQECESYTDIPPGLVGVYYSDKKPTKFYFSIESQFESLAGQD